MVNSALPDGHTDADKHAKKKLTKEERESGEMGDVRTEPAGAVEMDDTGLSLSSAAAKSLPRSLAASPAPSPSTNRPSQIDLASPTESGGTRTPVNNRLKRNPWTLFINQLPVPVSEDEIKAYFGPAASKVCCDRIALEPACRLTTLYVLILAKIIGVKIPINHFNKQQKAVAFVEFGDKDTMEDAINKHHDVSIVERRTGISIPILPLFRYCVTLILELV